MAAKSRVLRLTAATWMVRCLKAEPADRPLTPRRSPHRTAATVVELIESRRRERKWLAPRAHRHLIGLGNEFHPRVIRHVWEALARTSQRTQAVTTYRLATKAGLGPVRCIKRLEGFR